MSRSIRSLLALAFLISLALSPVAVKAAPPAPVPLSRMDETKPGGIGLAFPASVSADAASALAGVEAVSPDVAEPLDNWSRIVFQSLRNGNSEIYGSRPDGSQLARLTNNPAADGRPRQSYAHGRIAFVSDRTGNFEIYTMASDGSDVRQVTNDPAEDNYPSWSPDGKRIAFASDRNGSWDIYIVNADGSGMMPIVIGSQDDYEPAWSPDGRYIAWLRIHERSGRQLYLFDVNTATKTFLDSYTYPGDITWSPDSGYIGFSCDCLASGWLETRQIYVGLFGGRLGASTTTVIYKGGPLTDVMMGSYSPDGKYVVVTIAQYQVADGRLKLASARLAQVQVGRIDPPLRFLPGVGLDLNGNWQHTDFTPPRSHLNPLPRLVQEETDAQVSWTSSDAGGSGLVSFDVQRSHNGGPWEDILWNYERSKYEFYSRAGIVKIRVRARDAAGNVEPWPASPDGDGQVIVYGGLREGWVRDIRGLPIPLAYVRGASNPSTPFLSAADGRYEAYSFAGFYPLTVTHPGYGSLPAYYDRGERALRLDVTLPPKVGAVRNGGFEDGLRDWQIDGSEGVTHETAGHSGQGSVRLGVRTPADPAHMASANRSPFRPHLPIRRCPFRQGGTQPVCPLVCSQPPSRMRA